VSVSMKCPPEQSRHCARSAGKIVYHHLSTILLHCLALPSTLLFALIEHTEPMNIWAKYFASYAEESLHWGKWGRLLGTILAIQQN